MVLRVLCLLEFLVNDDLDGDVSSSHRPAERWRLFSSLLGQTKSLNMLCPQKWLIVDTQERGYIRAHAKWYILVFLSPSPSSSSGLQKVDTAFASCLVGTSGAGPQECGFRWGYKSTILISAAWMKTHLATRLLPILMLFPLRIGVGNNSALFQCGSCLGL